MRRLVRVNELGLVTPPERLDCLGEACPVAKHRGHCFVDEHHLYFPRANFLTDALSDEFQSDPFNRIRLPRCQHNSANKNAIHSRFYGTPKPRPEVMKRFLEEATLLREVGVVAIRSEGLWDAIQNRDEPTKRRGREEALEQARAQLGSLVSRAQTECEVVFSILMHRPHNTPNIIGSMAVANLIL